MSGISTILVRKGLYVSQSLIWHDFTKYLLPPYSQAIGPFQAIVISSTNPEVHRSMDCFESFWTHPFLQMFSVSMHFEHQVTRCIENSGNTERCDGLCHGFFPVLECERWFGV